LRVKREHKLNRNDRAWDHHEVGKIAQNKLINIIKSENIVFKQTYEASRNKNAYYRQKYDYAERRIVKSIEIPKYSDYTSLEQAIVTAHELGHYLVYKSCRTATFRLLTSGNKYATYLNEYLAWRKAKSVLRKMKLFKVDGFDGIFKNRMYHALNTYKPSERFSVYLFKNVVSFMYVSVKHLVLSYFFVGLVFLYEMNDLPLPFNILPDSAITDGSVNTTIFYGGVILIYTISLAIKYIEVKKFKDR